MPIVWELKDSGTEHEIMWDLIDRAPSFNPITKKMQIVFKRKVLCEVFVLQHSLGRQNWEFWDWEGCWGEVWEHIMLDPILLMVKHRSILLGSKVLPGKI